MLPQIIVTVWLTITWVFITRELTEEADFVPAVIAALVHISVLVIALAYGGFWNVQ